MDKIIRVSAVSYTNTFPFLYGLNNHSVASKLDISRDYPALVAEKLLNGRADIGLVPAAVFPDIVKGRIITPFCIGATGPVGSVMLYSNEPLNKITNIALDYQSRTSVMLVRILCKMAWKINPHFTHAEPGFEETIVKGSANLVIGDRTFNYPKVEHQYDLAEEWIKYTGLPFVFALWVSTLPVDTAFESQFTSALALGLDNREELIKSLPPERQHFYRKYLTEQISYSFDEQKEKGLALFLQMIQDLKALD